MQLSFLLAPWNEKISRDCDIRGLQNDSRKVTAGDLFFAYPGAIADGRLFMTKAVEAGAVALVYDPFGMPETLLLPENIACIPVANLASQLAAIAARFYGNAANTLCISGVTGTNGKTTIAWQLAQAHALLGQKSAYMGTLGQGETTHLEALDNTTPDALCIQKLLYNYQNSKIRYLCMEVSSHALCLHRVDSVKFTQAIFTNLTHDHLDFHKTMQDYAQAKARLFAWPDLETAIINNDDDYAPMMKKALGANVRQLTYGLGEGALVRASAWTSDMRGTTVSVDSPWGRHQLTLNSLGKFNIYNGLAVFASLLASAYPIEDILAIMPKLQAAPGRMEVVAKNPCVIVDYAHTPDALENSLTTLNALKEGRLWVIFGCGGDRDKAKRPLMGKAAEKYADTMVITSDNPRSEKPEAIIDDIMQGLHPDTQALGMVNRETAIRHALDHASEKDIILIAGKGHEAWQQIGAVRYAFSDQDIVREYFRQKSVLAKNCI